MDKIKIDDLHLKDLVINHFTVSKRYDLLIVKESRPKLSHYIWFIGILLLLTSFCIFITVQYYESDDINFLVILFSFMGLIFIAAAVYLILVLTIGKEEQRVFSPSEMVYSKTFGFKTIFQRNAINRIFIVVVRVNAGTSNYYYDISIHMKLNNDESEQLMALERGFKDLENDLNDAKQLAQIISDFWDVPIWK